MSSTASSERSDLGSACTTVTGGPAGSATRRSSTASSSRSLPAATTSDAATTPRPSESVIASPTRIRRTVAACLPSGPSSTATPPAGGMSSR